MIKTFHKAAYAAFAIICTSFSFSAFAYPEDPFANAFNKIPMAALSADPSVLSSFWIPSNLLTVDNAADLETTMEVAVQTIDKGNGVTDCQLMTDHAEFKKMNPWHPLAMRMNTKKRGANGGVDDAFGKTLTFYEKESNPQQVSFKADFVQGKFAFYAMWRIRPYKIEHVSKDKGTCSTMTEICNDIEADTNSGKYICKGEWEWMERLSVQVDGVKYYLGNKDYITGITGHYRFIEERNGQKVLRSYTEKIK